MKDSNLQRKYMQSQYENKIDALFISLMLCKVNLKVNSYLFEEYAMNFRRTSNLIELMRHSFYLQDFINMYSNSTIWNCFD